MAKLAVRWTPGCSAFERVGVDVLRSRPGDNLIGNQGRTGGQGMTRRSVFWGPVLAALLGCSGDGEVYSQEKVLRFTAIPDDAKDLRVPNGCV